MRKCQTRVVSINGVKLSKITENVLRMKLCDRPKTLMMSLHVSIGQFAIDGYKSETVIQNDSQVMAQDIITTLNIRVGGACTYSINQLHYRKVSSCWTPRMLTDEYEFTRSFTSIMLIR